MPSIFDIFFLGFFRKVGPHNPDMHVSDCTQNPEGVYTLGLPVPGSTKLPMIDIGNDAGLFVAAILLNLPDTLGKRVAASGGYITPDEAVKTFSEVTGKKAVYNQLPWDLWSSFLPPKAKEEMTANWHLNENPGYFGGEPVDAVEQGQALVAKAGLRKPSSWKEFVAANFKE